MPIGNLLGRINFEQPITVLYDRVAFGLTNGKDVRSRNNWRFRICDEVSRSYRRAELWFLLLGNNINVSCGRYCNVWDLLVSTVWERQAHLWGMSTPARRRLMRDFKRYRDSQDSYVIVLYVIYRHCKWYLYLYFSSYNVSVHSESLKISFKTPQVTRRSNVIVARLTKLLLGVYNHLLRLVCTPNKIFWRSIDE